jgi:hypothetical protein
MKRAIDWEFELPLTTEAELRLFVEKAWGVRIPDTKVCPNHTTPWRAFADAYFARSPVAVWKASRGFGGKSFLLAVLALTEAVTLKADVNVLGGSAEQSENVHRYTQAFWDYVAAPKQVLVSDPSKRETKLSWGNRIRALTASQRSVRGPHPQRLRLDEIDEMDLSIFDAAMGQPMSKDGIEAQTVASSTHQHADKTMTAVLGRAAEKGWPVYEWCYRETSAKGGWLLESEIARKRTEVTVVQWNVEWDLQEPSPESRAIQPEKVAAMFKEELGRWRGYNGEYIEVEEPVDEDGNPIEGAEYSAGADWAKKRDWTVIVTFRTDVHPVRLVAFERCGRLPWPVMVDKFNARLRRYPGVGTYDATGLGDVVGGYLTESASGVLMVGRPRSDMLSNYIAAIERGEIVAPVIDFMHSEHKLASVEDVYTSSGHLPDSIAAGALAWLGAPLTGQILY